MACGPCTCVRNFLLFFYFYLNFLIADAFTCFEFIYCLINHWIPYGSTTYGIIHIGICYEFFDDKKKAKKTQQFTSNELISMNYTQFEWHINSIHKYVLDSWLKPNINLMKLQVKLNLKWIELSYLQSLLLSHCENVSINNFSI